MPTLTQSFNVSIAGYAFQSAKSRTAPASQAVEVSVAAVDLTPATVAQLTTRTDNDTGVITSPGGHGIQSADVVDVYWSTGIRYGMDATVSVNAITVDGGAGDNLPTNLTSVYICKQTVIDDHWADTDGDSVEALLAISNVRGHVEFREDDDTAIAAAELVAGEAYEYWSGTIATNPFTGVAVAKLAVSIGTTDTAAYIRCGALF